MANELFCSECGLRLQVIRKAMPRFGRIVDLIEPHVCLEVPIEPSFEPNPMTPFTREAKGKFVQVLNKLEPGPGVWPDAKKFGVPEGDTLQGNVPGFGMIGTDDLADRRGPEVVKSTAPQAIFTGLSQMQNSTPSHDLVEPEGNEAVEEE